MFDPTNPSVPTVTTSRILSFAFETTHVRISSAELDSQSLIVTYHPGTSGATFEGVPASLSKAVWDAQERSWTRFESARGW